MSLFVLVLMLHSLLPEGVKQFIGRVSRVPHDAPAPADLNVPSGREAAASGLLVGFHHSLQCLPVSSRAVPVPGGDGEDECALYHTLVEGCQHWGVEAGLPEPPEEAQALV